MRVRGRNLITRNRPADNADVMARSIRRPAILHRRNGRRRLFGYVSNSVSIKPLRQYVSLFRMAVSRWERGTSEPPSHTYIEMANAAGDSAVLVFLGSGWFEGKEDLLRVTLRLQERLRKAQIPRRKS